MGSTASVISVDDFVTLVEKGNELAPSAAKKMTLFGRLDRCNVEVCFFLRCFT